MGQKPQTVLAFYLGQTRTRPKGGRVWPAGRRFRNAEPGGPQCGPQAKPWPQRGHHKQNRAAKRPTKPNQAATRPTASKTGPQAAPSQAMAAARPTASKTMGASRPPSQAMAAARPPQAKPGRKAPHKQNQAAKRPSNKIEHVGCGGLTVGISRLVQSKTLSEGQL